jgi:hypothetical protein
VFSQAIAKAVASISNKPPPLGDCKRRSGIERGFSGSDSVADIEDSGAFREAQE